MALFGPAQLMSPQERAEAIRSGAMSPEDFLPAVARPVAPAGYDNRPSSAQQDLAKSLGITVEELQRRQALQLQQLMQKRQNKASGGAVGNRGRVLPSSDQSNLGALNLMKGLTGMLGSAGRGAVAATLGFPGDLTRMGYTLTGNEQPGKGWTLLPDTSDMRRKLPSVPVGMRADVYDSLGSQMPLSPGQVGKVAGLAGLGGAEVLARAMNSEGALASMLTAGMRPIGAVKGKGGQWLAGSVEDALKPMRKTSVGMDPVERLKQLDVLRASTTDPELLRAIDIDYPNQMRNLSLNNWIDGPLAKYVKRDMGTPNDPVVKLADQGIQVGDAPYTHNATRTTKAKRAVAGFPEEGDTMGHCVGGYCDDVASGRSNIFSLRDSTGQPHVTIETGKGNPVDPDDPLAAKWIKDRAKQHENEYGKGAWDVAMEDYINEAPHSGNRIVQIKGKGNAKPHDDYLPYVQDFVKNGRWSDVGDLQNSGLRKAGDKYVTDGEYEQLLDMQGQGFAKGGLVSNDVLALYGYN